MQYYPCFGFGPPNQFEKSTPLVQSVPYALLPVMRLIAISNHLKRLQITDVQNSGKRSVAGPKFKTDGFWLV